MLKKQTNKNVFFSYSKEKETEAPPERTLPENKNIENRSLLNIMRGHANGN